jgi:hypothetical protein
MDSSVWHLLDILSRTFPDIVAMRDSILEGDKQLTVYSKRYTEMYSNFGFVHDKV